MSANESVMQSVAPNRELVERPLPCGGWTRDFEKYKTEWARVGAAVTAVSGWRLEAYDPNFLFRNVGGEALVLPINFVRAVWLRQLDEANEVKGIGSEVSS